ncbi:MAG: EamA family transporter [Bacillota bacterium]
MNSFFYALLGAFFWGLAPVLGKLGLVKVDPTLALAFRSFLISAVLLVWLILSGSYLDFTQVPLKSWAFIAGEGLLASLLGHLAYYYALQGGQVTRVAPVLASYPMITFFLAILILGEKFSWTKMAGVGLILGGVMLVSAK